MYIAIAGNIGSGKTTLANILNKHYGWEVHYENEEDPYLYDFYADMSRWSFNLQISFLSKRLKRITEIQNSNEIQILDRSIYEDAKIFAKNLHSLGLMSTIDYECYISLYETTISLVTPPLLLIYLKASVPTIVNQIQKRGRKYEEGIRIDYLKSLDLLYQEWISTYPNKYMVIDIDNNNFSENEKAINKVISDIDANLFGLFK